MPPLEDITEQEAYAEAWRYLHNIYKDAPAFQLAQRGTAPIEVAKLIGRIIQPFKSEDGSSIGDNSSQSPYSELTSSSSISGGDSEHESSSVARPGSTTPRASEYSAAPTSVASGSQYSPTPTPTPRGSVAPTLRGDNTFHPSTRYAPTPCGHYGNGSETPHAQATPAPGGDNGWGFSTPYGVEAPTPQGNYGFGSATPLPSIESLLSPHRQGMEPAPSASPYSSLSPAHAPTPSPAHAPSPSPVPALPPPSPTPEVAQILCRHCGRTYQKLSVLKTHIWDRHCGTRCYWPRCGHTTITEDELLIHLSIHQKQAVQEGLPDTSCPWPGCDKTFSRYDSVLRCLKRHTQMAPRGN